MNVLLLGAPGSGKGSQAEFMVRDLSMVQISTGDLLRQAVSKGTELGKAVKSIMDKGDLVSDELVSEILSARMEEPDCDKGIVFDGYPRTLKQADILNEILNSKGKRLDLVININVPFDVIVKRLTSRRVCSSCGKGFNVISNPPEGDNCGKCGGKIIARDDDREDVIRKRLGVYLKSTEPLIDHYTGKGILVNIDGDRTVGTIWEELRNIFKERTDL